MRPRLLAVAVLLLGGTTARAQEGFPLFTKDFPAEEFAQRRTRILDAIGPNAIALLQGAASPLAYVRFRQSNEFYYLSGIEIPHAYLLIDGAVSLHLDRAEESHALRAVEAGEFFGHDALLCREAQRWSARAEGPSTLLRFDASTIDAAVERGGPLATLLQERLAVSSARQLRDANALLLRCGSVATGPAPAPTNDDAEAYVARVAASMGVDPEALEVRVKPVSDLGPAWKRR